MRVSGAMSTNVIEVKPDDRVSAAIETMNARNAGSAMVCDGTRLVGIFTERDVLRLAASGEAFAERAVREVMTAPVVTVTGEDTIVDAAELMRERGIRHLAVVEGDNLAGVLSMRDVMGSLVELVWSAHDEKARETARDLLRRR